MVRASDGQADKRLDRQGGRTIREAFLQKAEDWVNRPEKPMEARPLLEHLKELRRTLIVCVLTIAGAFAIVFFGFSHQLIGIITGPLTEQGIEVIFTGVSEAFTAQTMLSLIVGVVLASPLLFVAVWRYLSPGLYRKERIVLGGVVLIAAFLFALGIYFAYRYVFFLAVHFFVYAGDGLARPMLSLETYVSFLFRFLLPFGIMFELPIVVTALTRLGLVTVRGLCRARKYVIFGLTVLAAILTPPDVISQLMLGIPMWLLFEIGVFCSWLVRPRKKSIEISKGKGEEIR